MILDQDSSGWTAREVDPEEAEAGQFDPTVPLTTAEQVIDRRQPYLVVREVGLFRVGAQIGAVVLLAVLVGIVVFSVVRAAVGSGDDRPPDAVGDDLTPGPDEQLIPNPDGSRSGSRRSEADGGVVAGPNRDDRDGQANLDGFDRSSGGDTDAPGGSPSSTVATGPTTPTSGSPATGPSSTTPGGSSTTGGPTTTDPSGSTTTDNATTSSKPDPSTTGAPLPPRLITGPADGATLSWHDTLRLRAASVPGATTYCWTVMATGRDVTCGGDRAVDIPQGSVPPGPVTISAEALDASGAVLMSGRVSIRLLATDFLTAPSEGDRIEDNQRLRVRSAVVPTATNYCWSLAGPDGRSAEVCDPDRRRSYGRRNDDRQAVGTGKVQVIATAYRGDTLIGIHAVSIILED